MTLAKAVYQKEDGQVNKSQSFNLKNKQSQPKGKCC